MCMYMLITYLSAQGFKFTGAEILITFNATVPAHGTVAPTE